MAAPSAGSPSGRSPTGDPEDDGTTSHDATAPFGEERAAGRKGGRWFGDAMTRPQVFLLRMGLFVLVVAAALSPLVPQLLRAFAVSPALNGMIGAVLLIGILHLFRQVWLLGREVAWIETYRRGQPGLSLLQPRLLSAMAAMLGEHERGGRLSLSPLATRSLLDSTQTRLDEQRELSRYLIGLLVFLGLLGTFWGLQQTISAIGEGIVGLSGGGNPDTMFAALQKVIEAPLAGMGTAFGSSLFGLGGSLVLGFLELQASQAQNRFSNELEEWLSSLTRLGGVAAAADGEAGSLAYVQALLAETVESMDALERNLHRSEDSRAGLNAQLVALTEKLGTMADTMRAEQALLARLAETQITLVPIMARLAEAADRPADEGLRASLRNLELYAARIYDDLAAGRAETIDSLRAELRVLARTIGREPGGDRKT